MNPLLDIIFRDLANGTAVSALPGAPVVRETPGRAAEPRRAVGAALHGLARRIEPRDPAGVEAACVGAA